MNGSKTQFSTEVLSNGVYFVRLLSSEGNAVLKFVVEK
jgi:hypothetical protein